MDRLEQLGNSLSQITMYDIKTMYNQAKNVVLNVSEIEAKVQEATNDDPWGASSSLMQDIANRTFNYPDFNEIMPSIYSRFMEKEARQWRQIYKALQLLEYLIKHGSERVVDDARSHISTVKMLRNFHYIDDKGKDQGINVRNRSKEIVEMLTDVEKIRTERRKAKANKHKYTGTGNDGMSFTSGGGRYGGFGSESASYGAGGSSSYSNDYSSNSYSSGGFRDSNNRRGFEEYNAGDDEDVSGNTPSRSDSTRRAGTSSSSTSRKASAPAPEPAPVVDLLGGFDEESVAAPAANTNKALPALGQTAQAPQSTVSLDDDDFGDFSAAPTSPPPQNAKPNLMEMLQSAPAAPQQPAVNTNVGYGGMGGFGGMHRPTGSVSSPNVMSSQTFNVGRPGSVPLSQPFSPQVRGGQQPNYFGTAPLQPTSTGTTTSSAFSSSMRPTPAQTPSTMSSMSAASPKPKGGNFDDLWTMSLGSSGSKPGTPAGGKSIKDLEKEKANAGLWGGRVGQKSPMGQQGSFGAFGVGGSFVGGASASKPANGDGADDLLL